MNQTSTSCSLVNITKVDEDFEKLQKEIDQDREDYLKNLTR